MSSTRTDTPTIALIGNPNTGKSTLFNALCGVRQRVGNYPGVTVEKKVGQFRVDGRRISVVDLPGTYSLAPRSPDEMVAVDVLLGRRRETPLPDAVVCIVDASNLERNLYLVSQVLELGRPTILALNMCDMARERGQEIDVARLQQRLGIPVVPLEAHRRVGLDELKSAMLEALERHAEKRESPMPEAFRREVERLSETLAAEQVDHNGRGPLPQYLVERLLLDTGGYVQEMLLDGAADRAAAVLAAARERLAEAGCKVPAIEAVSRYRWVADVLGGVVVHPTERRRTWSDRFDHVLTHRLWGTLVFAAVMVIVFQSVFRWAGPAMGWIDDGCGMLGEAVEALMADGALRSLLVDGLIAGVGSVIVFLPQIFILFFFIAVLEDCGYMARAAYLMDKLMVRVGLSGKSFIPLLSSFACAIPGIMATRVIENRRDRLTTILVAPLMSCSARLPVYTMLIGAFIPARKYFGGLLTLPGLTLFAMYLVGIVTAVVVALSLKRTILRGPTPPFVMELPTYKIPSPRVVLYRMWDRGWAFIKRAGTVIVAVAIIVWAALYYPHAGEVEAAFEDRREAIASQLDSLPANDPRRDEVEAEERRLEDEILGEYQRQSYLGRMGRTLEPVFRPLGWDWRIGSAVIASFPAREVVIGTLGVIYNLGADVDPEGDMTSLQAALRQARWDGTDRPVFNLPVALSIMVFFALCAQCASTLVIIRRETNSWWWPSFTFTYMTVLAYLAAWGIYQVATWLTA